ncbi:MAG: response regulator [Desulfococcaceae bacterium]
MKDSVTIRREARILAVDDTAVNLHLLKTLLSVQGYTVQSAPSGKYALKYLMDKSCDLPDLILLDIRMPEPDGYEVCKVLKNDDRTRDIPIIFISALNETMDKVRAFSLGGVDYITKPFQTDEVLSRIRTHLSLQRMHKDLLEKNLQLEKEIVQRKQVEEALRSQSHELSERIEERDRLISELKNAAAQIKTLRGLIPICAGCKKIRNDQGYWEQIEIYIREHADVSFTHGICPDCKLRLYPPSEYPELYRQNSGVSVKVSGKQDTDN